MRFILFLLVSTTLGDFSPEYLRNRFGDQVNISAAESIIAEEAKILGVEERQLLEQCTVYHTQFWNAIYLTPEKSKWFPEEHPNEYALLPKKLAMIVNFITQLDVNGQIFIRNCTDLIFSKIQEISDIDPEDRLRPLREVEEQIRAEIEIMYEDLPEETKNSLEKVFCIRTARRLSFAVNDNGAHIVMLPGAKRFSDEEREEEW